MKTVVVTGASSGFGRGLVTLLLERGWTVMAGVRRLEERKELFREESQRFPKTFHLIELDVANPTHRKSLKNKIERDFHGHLDVLVNNAGVGSTQPFEILEEDKFREIFESNFFGPTQLTKELLPFLRHTKGRIISVSSILGQVGFPFNSHYCASKFALEGWAESLSLELAHTGVQVCLVEPGAFRTAFAQNLISTDESLIDKSPYRRVFNGFKKTLEERLKKPGKSPLIVSQKMAELCEASHLPLRVVVGSDAQGLSWIKKVFPERTRTKMLKRFVKKLEKRSEVAL